VRMNGAGDFVDLWPSQKWIWRNSAGSKNRSPALAGEWNHHMCISCSYSGLNNTQNFPSKHEQLPYYWIYAFDRSVYSVDLKISYCSCEFFKMGPRLYLWVGTWLFNLNLNGFWKQHQLFFLDRL
jgi:hypothetical protein